MSDNECQSRFITYNRIITPEAIAQVCRQEINRNSLYFLLQFCYESKVALKNSLLIFRKQLYFILENANDFFQLSAISSSRKTIWAFYCESLCIFLSLYTPVCECICFPYLKNGEIWVLILIQLNPCVCECLYQNIRKYTK